MNSLLPEVGSLFELFLRRIIVQDNPPYKKEAGHDDLLFLDPRDAETGFLSNFYRAEFMLDGAQWPTVEHFYQAQKFADMSYVERIRLAATPRAAKNLGQTRDVPMRADWDGHRMTAMLRALAAKFTQHESLQQKLLATGNAILVEASPHDSFWGAGPDNRGENRLGLLLTTLRKHLNLILSQADSFRPNPEDLAQQCLEAVRLFHSRWWVTR